MNEGKYRVHSIMFGKRIDSPNLSTLPSIESQGCDGNCLATGSQQQTTLLCLAIVDLHGINKPTMASFKLPI